MSENQTATNGPNQLKRTTNYLINEQLAKIQQDTQELINRTIDIGQPAQVSVVKVSENKIIIEVDLNELNHKQTQPAVSLAGSQPDESATLPKAVLRQQNSSTPKSAKSKQQQNDSSARQPGSSKSGDQLTNQQQSPDQSNSENQPLKGILKYSNSWKKRTLSESSFDNSSSFTDHEDDDNSFNLSLSCTDLDVYAERSASKRVTFNKQIASKVLIPKSSRTGESSGAGKKGKNGKKKSNKKAKSNNESERKATPEIKPDSKPKKQADKEEASDKNLSIDELSFLVCSSDSESSPEKASDAGDQITMPNVEEEDDLLDLQSKIEHQPFDDESWSELKSSKKKKRNNSGNSQSSIETNDGHEDGREASEHAASERVSSSPPSNCEQERQPMSLEIKRSSLAIEVN